MNGKKIVKNAVQCGTCKDIIESKRPDNCVTCKCGAICISGGLDCLLRSFQEDVEVIELSEYETTEKTYH